MGLKGIVGRAIARVGVRLAGEELFEREPGFPTETAAEPDAEHWEKIRPGEYALTPAGQEMLASTVPSERETVSPPAPLEGSAEARIALVRAGVRS